MRDGVVYIKTEQDTRVVNKRIMLQDVAEIYTNDTKLKKEIGEIIVYTAKGDKDEKIIFSVMKIIEMIHKIQPDIIVENIGEADFIVEYRLPGSPSKLWKYTKLCAVILIVFFGSAFTIMTFNTDVSVGAVFDDFYYLVTGTHKSGGSALEIAYSIGIPIGILGFYNHFNHSKLREDPTPIHIEMRNYEEETNKAIIQDASREGKMRKQ